MRYLHIGKDNGADRLRVLGDLMADVDVTEGHYDVAKAVYVLLQSRLSVDLTLNQYAHLVRDAEMFWQVYLRQWDNEAAMETKLSWIIRQYLLKKYFANGLFLDDIREPKDVCNYMDETAALPYLLGKWTVARTYEEFVSSFGLGNVYDRVSLDHDLGEDENGGELRSGYDAVKWLVDQVLDEKIGLPEVWCHSQNPVGKANIMGYWESFRKASRR